MKIEFYPIGYIRNAVNSQKDTDWGNDVSAIEIDRQYEKGLTGLSDFSHIIVIYYLDQACYCSEKHLVRRPQGREDMPFVGILSQRAKDRPNPVGITAVKLISVNDNIIKVKGLDAVDGTPVIDIKPYFPQFDCKHNAVVPEWVNRLMEHYF